jgi:hypothetical protein
VKQFVLSLQPLFEGTYLQAGDYSFVFQGYLQLEYNLPVEIGFKGKDGGSVDQHLAVDAEELVRVTHRLNVLKFFEQGTFLTRKAVQVNGLELQ